MDRCETRIACIHEDLMEHIRDFFTWQKSAPLKSTYRELQGNSKQWYGYESSLLILLKF